MPSEQKQTRQCPHFHPQEEYHKHLLPQVEAPHFFSQTNFSAITDAVEKTVHTESNADFRLGLTYGSEAVSYTHLAGLQIINPNGADPTAKYEVLLRGTNTLSAGQGPLIIIDGIFFYYTFFQPNMEISLHSLYNRYII